MRRERRIAADPTSLALLLAGPTGVDLWPGARRAGASAGCIRVEAEVPETLASAPLHLLVRADAPQRTPVAFVLRFGWSVQSDEAAVSNEVTTDPAGADAVLTLAYEGDETEATLDISLTPHAESRRAEVVEAMAGGFLDNLAAAAEARSRAA